jgi:hypothetical protein
MKRTLLLFFALTSFVFHAFAQSQEDLKIDTIDLTKPVDITKPPDTLHKVFTVIESEAIFPGGIREFYKYLTGNINIPSTLYIKGRVLISFVVDLDGHITEAKIVKGVVTEGMRKEIVRVFSESPKWQPAIQNSKPVRIQYSIPINF